MIYLRGSGCHPEASDTRHSTRDEDRAATAGVLVENGTSPTTDESGAEVWCSIGEASHPYIVYLELLKIEFLKHH